MDALRADDTLRVEHDLPLATDGRTSFEAGSERLSPGGTVVEMSGDGRPGWWQHRGDQWVPIDPPTVVFDADVTPGWLPAQDAAVLEATVMTEQTIAGDIALGDLDEELLLFHTAPGSSIVQVTPVGLDQPGHLVQLVDRVEQLGLAQGQTYLPPNARLVAAGCVFEALARSPRGEVRYTLVELADGARFTVSRVDHRVPAVSTVAWSFPGARVSVWRTPREALIARLVAAAG